MFVSIVIPSHNEARRIPLLLERYGILFERLRRTGVLDYELLVVINNTQDNTLDIVKKAQKKNKRIRYLNFDKGGKGFAVIEGFKDALRRPANLIGFADADMATPPESFYDLVRHIEGHQGIIAARWKRGSRVTRQTLLFRVKSWIFNFIVRCLFGFPYSDTQCGAKLFTRDAVEYVQNRMNITKWAFDIDILYKLRKGGFSIIEVPTVWESKDDSKIKLVKASLEMLLAVFRLRLVHSPFIFIVRAYDALPQGLKVHHRIWNQ